MSKQTSVLVSTWISQKKPASSSWATAAWELNNPRERERERERERQRTVPWPEGVESAVE